MKVLSISLLLFSALPCFSQDHRSAALNHSVVVNADFSQQPLPTFQGGYLVGRRRTPPGFSLWDRTGKLVHTEDVALTGAVSTAVVDIALTPTGDTVALVLEGSDSQRHFVSAIAFGTPTGGITKIVRMASFAPRRVVFASDGTLWAFGREYAENFEERPEYKTVRHYDRQGQLLGTALPRRTFSNLTNRMSPSTDSYLAASNDRVGVLSLVTSDWVELSLTGEVLGRWPVQFAPSARVTGVAMTSSGEVFVSMEHDGSASKGKTALDSITLSQLDKTQGVFVEVATAGLRAAPHQGLLILGSEGDQLVLRVKPPWQLAWVRVN